MKNKDHLVEQLTTNICDGSRPNLHICSILKGWFGPVCGVWGVRTPLSGINITHWPHLTFARCQYMRKMLVEMFRGVIIADLIEMTWWIISDDWFTLIRTEDTLQALLEWAMASSSQPSATLPRTPSSWLSGLLASPWSSSAPFDMIISNFMINMISNIKFKQSTQDKIDTREIKIIFSPVLSSLFSFSLDLFGLWKAFNKPGWGETWAIIIIRLFDYLRWHMSNLE